VPERVGSKVLPIPTKSLVFLMENKETLGEQQEPPRIHAGEVSDIYVYTYGLVYLNGNKSRVAYWRQMKRAYTNRGYLNISVQNETGISIPSYVSRFSELRARVKQAIASYRNLG